MKQGLKREGDAQCRVVLVTTFYPNANEPARAVFVENLAIALGSLLPLQIIAPVPLAPPMGRWRRLGRLPREESRKGIQVAHPRFVVVPRMGVLTGLTYTLGILVPLARLARSHRRLVVHAHCAYPDGVGVALAARLLGLPYVVTCHGSDLNVYSHRRGLSAQIGWALRGAARVIAVSEGLQRRAAALMGPGGAARISTIPCAAVNAEVFNTSADRRLLRRRLELVEDARIIVFVGELVPIKGVDTLLAAWGHLISSGRLRAEDTLLIIGSGREEAALRRQAGAFGSQVRFLGTLSQHDLAAWLRASDLLCLPSRNEGTPNVVIEALASGIPVVASRVGAIPALVQQGRTGFVVDPGDSRALAEALHQCLDQHWDEREIAASVAGFTWPQIAKSNADILNRVAGLAK